MADAVAPPATPESYSAIGPMEVLPGADDLEVVFARTIHAPRERVYAAFTDSELLRSWWGPRDYVVTDAQTDPRPSGRYRIVMQAPDGTEYPVHGIYVQADEPDRLVMTDQADEMPQDWQDLMNEYRGEEEAPLRLVMRILLEDADDGTRLTIINKFPSVADRDATLRMQAAEGWAESLEKLEQLLAAGSTRR